MNRSVDLTQALRRGEAPPGLEIDLEQDAEGTGGSRHSHCRLWLMWKQRAAPSDARQARLGWLRALEQLTVYEVTEHVLPEGAISRTTGAISKQAEPQRSNDWDRLNDRRVFLIGKRARADLDEAEQEELGQLQAEAETYVNALAPMPFDALDEFERQARSIIER